MSYIHRVANFTCTGPTIQIHHLFIFKSIFRSNVFYTMFFFLLSFFFAATEECELQTTVGVRFPVCALNLTDTNVEQM